MVHKNEKIQGKVRKRGPFKSLKLETHNNMMLEKGSVIKAYANLKGTHRSH
jgi:hypothetical protein